MSKTPAAQPEAKSPSSTSSKEAGGSGAGGATSFKEVLNGLSSNELVDLVLKQRMKMKRKDKNMQEMAKQCQKILQLNKTLKSKLKQAKDESAMTATKASNGIPANESLEGKSEQEIKELKDEVSRLKNLEAELSESLKASKEALVVATDREMDSKSQIEKLKAQAMEAASKIENLETEKASLLEKEKNTQDNQDVSQNLVEQQKKHSAEMKKMKELLLRTLKKSKERATTNEQVRKELKESLECKKVLEAEKQGLEEELRTCNARNQELENSVKEIQERHDSLEKEVQTFKEMHRGNNEVEEALKTSNARNQELEASMTDIKLRHDTMKVEYQTLKERAINNDNTVKELLERNQLLETEGSKIKSSNEILEEEKEKLQLRIEDSEKKLKECEKNLKVCRDALDQHEKKSAAGEAVREGLENECRAVLDSKKNLEEEHRKLSVALSKTETVNQDLADRNKDLQKHSAELSQKVYLLEQTLKSMQKESGASETQSTSVEIKDTQRMPNNDDTSAKDSANSDEEVKKLEEDLKKSSLQIQNVNSENQNLKQQIAEVKEELMVASEKLKGLQTEKNDLQVRNDEQIEKYKQLQRHNELTQVTLKEKDTQLEERKWKHKNAEEKIANLKEQLSQLESRRESEAKEAEHSAEKLIKEIESLEEKVTELQEKLKKYEDSNIAKDVDESGDNEREKDDQEEIGLNQLKARNMALTESVNRYRKASERVEKQKKELEKELEELKNKNEKIESKNQEEIQKLTQSLDESKTQTAEHEHTIRTQGQTVAKLQDSIAKYKELVARFKQYSARAQKMKAEHDDLIDKYDALKALADKARNHLLSFVPDLDKSLDLAHMCKTVGISFEHLEASSGRYEDEKEQLKKKLKELESEHSSSSQKAVQSLETQESQRKRIGELERENKSHVEKVSKLKTLLRHATVNLEENKDKLQESRRALDAKDRTLRGFRKQFQEGWFAPTDLERKNNGSSTPDDGNIKYEPYRRIRFDGTFWVLVRASQIKSPLESPPRVADSSENAEDDDGVHDNREGSSAPDKENLFWARQDVYLENVYSADNKSDSKDVVTQIEDNKKELIAQLEDEPNAVTLPNGTTLPACSITILERQMELDFEVKWSKLKNVFEAKIQKLEIEKGSLKKSLEMLGKEQHEYKTRAHTVLQGQKSKLNKALSEIEKREGTDQQLRLLKSQMAEMRKKVEVNLETEQRLQDAKNETQKLKLETQKLVSQLGLQKQKFLSEIEILKNQLDAEKTNTKRQAERIREESKSQSAKLVTAFRKEQERLKLLYSKTLNRCESLERKLQLSSSSIPPMAESNHGQSATMKNNSTVQPAKNDGKVTREADADENKDEGETDLNRRSAENARHIQRLQKMLREMELKHQKICSREKVLIEECDELKRSLARAEAGEIEYSKNIFVKYMENVGEQESLLPVVAKVLKLSEQEVANIKKKRAEGSSFFSLNFL
mmetsp:Transcript_18416/g.45207  ORF Transcript_18416/g.45207 Transcript_18416/m.45207 type:complete len:1464 (-) Transcript_18416:141-4532(-)